MIIHDYKYKDIKKNLEFKTINRIEIKEPEGDAMLGF